MSSPAVPVPSLIPAPHFIGWRQKTATGTKNVHGNKIRATADAVAMPCQGFYQVGTQQPINIEYDTRQVYEVDVLVPDGSPYGKGDEILIGGTANLDGSYSGGRAFAMDGHSEDYTTGSPWVEMNGVFGDVLRVKRTG